MAKIKFYKMVSAGNDFIVIDHRKRFLKNVSDFTRKVCHPHFGVGADGVLLVERSKQTDLRMRIINPDGSEAEMCGNGVRCAALFAHRVLRASKQLAWETKGGPVSTKLNGSKVLSEFSPPRDYRSKSSIAVNGHKYEFYFVNTGVPHAVIFVDQLEQFPVVEVGRFIRYHPRFAPRGTNVNFVKIKNRRNIEIRTYERGVENETLACGTGVAASAVVSGVQGFCRPPITVHTKGGERLAVNFNHSRFRVEHVVVEGPARFICEGILA